MRAAPYVLALGVALFAAGSVAAQTAALLPLDDVPLAMPMGVTFQEKPGRGMMAPSSTILGDARGQSLYTFENDTVDKKGVPVSTCVDACATAWPPLAAPADAKAFGDWTVVNRAQGAKQWAYRGKPLYTHAADEKPGDVKGDKAENLWNVQVYAPDKGVKVPPGVAVRELAAANGWVFVNADAKPLYTNNDDVAAGKPTCVSGACILEWKPFLASQLSKTVGDFSVVTRGDGVAQWAYKGRPLYTYSGDREPGDTVGNGRDGVWRTAMLVRYPMPKDVTVWHNHFGGSTVVSATGMTLYTRGRGVGGVSGHSLRNAPRSPAAFGRKFGIQTCTDTCLQTWRPFAAPADAVAAGYWETIAREDGSKQWVYGGYPLYTFIGDLKPGQMNGVDIYEFLIDEESFQKYGSSGGGALRGAAALVWVAASP
jgi:predicted lipoprotein with Yx(FWY)xxD motif